MLSFDFLSCSACFLLVNGLSSNVDCATPANATIPHNAHGAPQDTFLFCLAAPWLRVVGDNSLLGKLAAAIGIRHKLLDPLL
jgi:hypothetical protein